MKQSDFVLEFEDKHFPSEFGPWVSVYAHDPPFTPGQLKRMQSAGLIELDLRGDRFRLTMKATAVRGKKDRT